MRAFFFRWWVGPAAVSVFLLTVIRLVEVSDDGGLAGGVGLFGGNAGLPEFMRPFDSAAEAVAAIEWGAGSSVVLDRLAACLERASEQAPAFVAPRVSASVSRPASTAPSPPPSAVMAEVPDPASPDAVRHPPDPVAGYYRDVCIPMIRGPAWSTFQQAYGRRPTAWTLQLLATGENAHAARRAAGAPPQDAWATGFAAAPGRLRALRAELTAVYSRAAGGASSAPVPGS